MSAKQEITDPKTARSDSPVTGFIDAITGDRIFGWAWDPQRASDRIAIRVDVDGKTAATTIADQPREDLASNGVGDGAHAFEIVLPAGAPPEKIGVFAVDPETGASTELTHRPVGGSLAMQGRVEELRGIVHAMVRSQRLLTGKIQSVVDAMQGLRNDEAAKAGGNSTASRLDALEIAVARVDAALREQATLLDTLAKRPQDLISRILACVGAALGITALIISLVR